MLENKINISKLKNFLTKLPWIIARHAFFSCLVLFLLAVAFGFLIFYKCQILNNSADFENIEPSYLLDYRAYDSVLEKNKKEKQKFQQADSKEYLNPFIFQTESGVD